MAALRDHRGPLRASLRAVYGIDLRDPGMTWLDLSDLVGGLPPGCALWRAWGGDLAWSDEVHALMAVEHGVRVLAWMQSEEGKAGRHRPQPATPPAPAGEAKEDDDRVARRAALFLERQRRRALTAHAPVPEEVPDA